MDVQHFAPKVRACYSKACQQEERKMRCSICTKWDIFFETFIEVATFCCSFSSKTKKNFSYEYHCLISPKDMHVKDPPSVLKTSCLVHLCICVLFSAQKKINQNLKILFSSHSFFIRTAAGKDWLRFPSIFKIMLDTRKAWTLSLYCTPRARERVNIGGPALANFN